MFDGIRKTARRFVLLLVVLVAFVGWFKFQEFMTLRQIVRNLRAESRIAEALVMESSVDEFTRKYRTTIKFLEYDVRGRALKPKYFTFDGNLIQFQTLVVRFDDRYVERGHRLKGKSVYLFLKAFVLAGKNTQEFPITAAHEVPEGYKVGSSPSGFEREMWGKFWKLALDPDERKRIGIKNAQIEAPGSVFVPGTIYTLMIEHDGGIRIDARPIPEILKQDATEKKKI